MPSSSSLYTEVRGRPVVCAEDAENPTIARLQNQHLNEVFRYVLRRVPRREDAEDITAEVFAAAFAGLSGFRGHCPAYLWLLTIARRKIIDFQRRRKRRPETLASELPDDNPEAEEFWSALPSPDGPEATYALTEARQMLRDLIAGLNEDQQEALALKYWEGLSIAEIAIVMGRSVSSVTSLLHRARSILFRRGRSYFLNEDGDRRDE